MTPLFPAVWSHLLKKNLYRKLHSLCSHYWLYCKTFVNNFKNTKKITCNSNFSVLLYQQVGACSMLSANTLDYYLNNTNQTTDFYAKCNTGLKKWVSMLHVVLMGSKMAIKVLGHM